MPIGFPPENTRKDRQVTASDAIPPDEGPQNPIAKLVLSDPKLVSEVTTDGIVIVVKDELLVRRSLVGAQPMVSRALEGLATLSGTLTGIAHVRAPIARDAEGNESEATVRQPNPSSAASDIEIWRLTGAALKKFDAISATRHLRATAARGAVPERGEEPVGVDAAERDADRGGDAAAGVGASPSVSPNHVAILSSWAGGCPASPPRPAHAPLSPFVDPPAEGRNAKVTVLDSGYIQANPPNKALDQRVTLVDGQRLQTSGPGAPSWVPDEPDGKYTNAAGQLDGISGHGTFIAGLIAHNAPRTELTVVGLRNQEVTVGGPDKGLYETEVAIARAMLLHSDADVINCGFAFPTLDDAPSLPFAAVMEDLRRDNGPRNGKVVVVAPAGNEASSRPFWPGALEDVIAVASTDSQGNHRASFSNWGCWCTCCCRGQDVYSTFIDWDGPIEGDPLPDILHFAGWANWDGTSFAAPKVAAAIARLVVELKVAPTDAWEALKTGKGGVPVVGMTDSGLAPHEAVTLPQIRLG
jgi:hypothetical protein